MECLPIKDYEQNLSKSSRKQCVGKLESNYFSTRQHVSDGTHGGITIYSITGQELLRDYSDKTRDREGENFGWVVVMLPTSLGCTHNNLWWDHSMHHKKAVSVFEDHYGSLNVKDQQHYFPDFVDFDRYGAETQSTGL